MSQFTVEPADPFNFSRLYGDEKYSLQNMLMRAVNFPNEGTIKAAFVDSQYSDRLYASMNLAWEKHLKGRNQGPYEGGGPLNALTDEDFLDYCRVALQCEQELTGARVVRFTNCASQYPVYRIDVYAKAAK